MTRLQGRILSIFVLVLGPVALAVYSIAKFNTVMAHALLVSASMIVLPLLLYTLWGLFWLYFFRWMLRRALHTFTMSKKHWVIYWSFLYLTCAILTLPYLFNNPSQYFPDSYKLVDWNALFSSLSLGWIFFAPVVVALFSLTISINNLNAIKMDDP